MKFFKFILAVFGIALAIIITELVLRIPPHTTLKFYNNPIFGSALVPNQKEIYVSNGKEYKTYVSVNSQGWADTEHSYDKPSEVYRILILGDSFVENLQVPFEKRFFRQLQERLGSKYEIIAMGRGNTGTAQQYLMLKNYGLLYHPDLLIHVFYEGNDVVNNSPILQNDPFLPYFDVNIKGDLIEIPNSQRKFRIITQLKEYLLNFRIPELFLAARRDLIRKNEASKIEYPQEFHIYDSNYSEEFLKAWKITKRLILESKKLAEENKSKYLFVTVPANEQVHKDVQDNLFKSYPRMSPGKVDFNRPDKILSDLCKEQVDCLSTTPLFQNYAEKNPGSRLYYFREGHWTEDGTNFFAETLFEKLKDYLTIK